MVNEAHDREITDPSPTQTLLIYTETDPVRLPKCITSAQRVDFVWMGPVQLKNNVFPLSQGNNQTEARLRFTNDRYNKRKKNG